MTDEAAKTVRVAIQGRVQGVGFRAWTSHKALGFGLSGWVRNRRDGSVEALFCGPAEGVDGMLAACWRGPSMARVDTLRATSDTPPDKPGFVQLPTA